MHLLSLSFTGFSQSENKPERNTIQQFIVFRGNQRQFCILIIIENKLSYKSSCLVGSLVNIKPPLEKCSNEIFSKSGCRFLAAGQVNEMPSQGFCMHLKHWFCIRNTAHSDLITLSIFFSRNIYQQRGDTPCIKSFHMHPQLSEAGQQAMYQSLQT